MIYNNVYIHPCYRFKIICITINLSYCEHISTARKKYFNVALCSIHFLEYILIMKERIENQVIFHQCSYNYIYFFSVRRLRYAKQNGFLCYVFVFSAKYVIITYHSILEVRTIKNKYNKRQ